MVMVSTLRERRAARLVSRPAYGLDLSEHGRAAWLRASPQYAPCAPGRAGDSSSRLLKAIKRAGEEFVGDQHELSLLNAQPNEQQPYERLLADALAGDRGAAHARGRR